MCVILIAQENRLTAATISAAIESNPDGNGFAWISKGKVHWRKGITPDAAISLAKTKPLPHVFHARIATIGEPCDALCHPFAVETRAEQTATSGSSSEGVVFHNGSWGDWQDNIDTPTKGLWSDSRAMADMVYVDGVSALDIIPDSQRVVMMTPESVEYRGIGWTTLPDGTLASNTHFLRQRYSLK